MRRGILEAGASFSPELSGAPRSLRAPSSPAELADAVRATGYLADEGLATVAWLAAAMRRPLLLEGEPGTGKTALAEALAAAPGRRPARRRDRPCRRRVRGLPAGGALTAAATLGAVRKYREDVERVRASLDRLLARQSGGCPR